MRKVSKFSFMFFAIITMAFASSSTPLKAYEESFGWVCCKNLSTGCLDMLGGYWPEDYQRNAPTCTIGAENTQ